MAADRFMLIGLALVALKFANFRWLSPLIPGRSGVYASDALEFLCFLAFVLLTALSCRSALPTWIQHLRLGRVLVLAPVALLVVGGFVVANIVGSLPGDSQRVDDANAMAVCGAQAIAAGHDPYQVKEFPCLRQMDLSSSLATPLRVGSLAHVRIYPTPAQIQAAVRTANSQGGTGAVFSGLAKPPLDPLVMVPVASQSSQIRSLWTLLAAAVFAVLLGIAAGPLWAAALAAFLATYYIPGSALNFASFGNAESVAYLLIALSVLWIRRPILSAVCLGLAIGSNELALFFLPAYLLLSLSLGDWRRRVGALGATLVVAVVPLLIAYPNALGTIWRYLSAPTFPLGYGPVVLILQYLIKPLSSVVFLAATATAMALTLLWGWVRPSWRISAGVLMLAGFWLSWRSLDEYTAQVPLLALAAILALLAARNLGQPEERDHPRVPAHARPVSANIAQPGGSATV
ncbi:MAG: glycosyltransferase 87 family protein [Candidatus Dormiibacterota bacterium]